ncbi:recombinase RecT [Pleomorphomonas oryzae]|uniref:recombinase RecT n=1 Tax=Pleomorphomonas oryzae TaxID=261934 RepID=UPI00042A2C0A|nr:recombinase RecT [Pleomorphomonas oryzae]
MSTELQQTEQSEKRTPTTIAAGLRPQLAETLPSYINPDSFARTIQTALQVNPKLLQCTSRSLMIACMKAAADGLILDGREAALIDRNVNVGTKQAPQYEMQATYQPMFQGLMKLARNSGDISSIIAHVVFKNDTFHYILGDEERIEHSPAGLEEDRGDPIACYAIAKLKDGTVVREILRKSEILNIAEQGKNAWQYKPESGKNYGEWWRKTLIRRICKYLPKSTDAIGRFVQAAERIDDDFDFELEPEQPAAKLPPPKKRGGAAEALKSINPTAPVEPDASQAKTFDDETGEIIDGEYTGDDMAEADTPKPKDDF